LQQRRPHPFPPFAGHTDAMVLRDDGSSDLLARRSARRFLFAFRRHAIPLPPVIGFGNNALSNFASRQWRRLRARIDNAVAFLDLKTTKVSL